MGIIFSTRTTENEKLGSINENTSKFAPSAIGPYSKAYQAGNILFCSGQIGLNPDTMELVGGGIEAETRQVCRNISHLLAEYGLSLKDVVKTTIFLKNISDFNTVNNIYKDYFVLKPARSTVEISKLPKGALIEIEVIANIEK